MKGMKVENKRTGPEREPKGSKMVKWIKIFKTEKALEIQQARLTEVYRKIVIEKNG